MWWLIKWQSNVCPICAAAGFILLQFSNLYIVVWYIEYDFRCVFHWLKSLDCYAMLTGKQSPAFLRQCFSEMSVTIYHQHGMTYQKAWIFINTAVRTSAVTYRYFSLLLSPNWLNPCSNFHNHCSISGNFYLAKNRMQFVLKICSFCRQCLYGWKFICEHTQFST